MDNNESKGLLIPFSGQRDAIELCATTAETYPTESICLVYMVNVGFRSKYEWPTKAAEMLSERFGNVERLIVADAGEMQSRLVSEFKNSNYNYGNMHSCFACQISLRILAELIGSKLNYSIADFTDKAPANMSQLFENSIMSANKRLYVPRLRTTRVLNLVSDIEVNLSERCALADTHAGAVAVLPEVAIKVNKWLKERTNVWGAKNGNMVGTENPERYITQVIALKSRENQP